jgi:hypothetical protein
MIIRKTPTELHPVGVYGGVITIIEEQEGQFGMQFMFRIETEGTGNNFVLYWVSQSLKLQTKLGELVVAAMGCQFEQIPDEFDTDLLIDRRVQVVVGHKPNQQGEMRAKVTAVMPPKAEYDDSEEVAVVPPSAGVQPNVSNEVPF